MKTWFLLLLLLSLEASVSCRRKRCRQGLKMNRRGRCIKGRGLSWPGLAFKNITENLASHVRNKLGTDVLIPCAPLQEKPYCEVCFKNDPGKIFCPKGKKDSLSLTSDYGKKSVYEDLSDYLCSVPEAGLDSFRGDAFSYWTGYDDGSICDCGTPFFLDNEEGVFSFRPLKNGESRPGFVEGPSYVDEDTGASLFVFHGGSNTNEWWEEEKTAFPATVVFDSRPPDVAPKSCSNYPDIASIFELRGVNGELSLQRVDKDCILEDTYLAWYNGEPIEDEVRGAQANDHSWCEEKCDANPECGAWTLNKNNGWCALKRRDQVKKQERDNFVSGIKNC